MQLAWQTPPPSSVDERLTLLGNGTGELVVLHARSARETIGTYRGPVAATDAAVLEAAGPSLVLGLSGDSGTEEVRAAAERIAAALRASPLATATFGVHAGSVADGRLGLSLVVTGAGSEAVVFEFDPSGSAVHFAAGDQTVGWQPFPEPAVGFTTADFELLGGARQRATVPPGALAAMPVEAAVSDGATQVSVQVSGWLHAREDEEPLGFEAWTLAVPLG